MNRLFKYLLSAVIVLGLGIELLKLTSQNDLNQSLQKRFELHQEAQHAFEVDEDQHRVSHTPTQQRVQRRAVRSPRKTAKIYNLKMEDFIPKKKTKKQKAKSKKKNKTKTAKKKNNKKKDKKKTAEKKKAKKVKPIKVAKDRQNIDSDSDATPGGDFTDYTGNIAGGGENTPQPEPETQQENETLSYEEWATLVLTSPSFNNTSYMIEEFRNRSKTIDSATFYRLVQEMISDDRSKMQEYGVLAARMTPSQKSFEVLASVMQTNNNGSSLRTQAEKAINEVYRKIQHLGVLRSVLTSSSSTFAVSIALKTLSVAALTLKEPVGNNSQENSAQNTAVGADHPYAARFTAFADILSTLEQTEDQEINTNASATRASLEEILGSA